MSLKHTLILLTLVSVVADTMLLPFYPQFFSQVFAESSATHVGAYIAACCFTVMTAFPFWAKVARKVNEVHLWIYTQIAAGCLGIYCAQTDSLVSFWIASQLMLVFKASYLLIYPYVLRLEEKDKHLNVAGLFSVLVHFGAIGGALVGGLALQFFSAQSVYYLMAASDALQVLICLWLVAALKLSFWNPPASATASIAQSQVGARAPLMTGWVLRISLVSMVFYFSSFLARPYFSLYWEMISGTDQKLLSALVYSIPAWVALACLWFNHKAKGPQNHFQKILLGSVVALMGLIMQGTSHEFSIIVGRCLFGYGLYQIMVRLEVLLFERSDPANYASDFSKIHFFQNLGVIGASFSVGYLVDGLGLVYTFAASCAGFALALALFYTLFKPQPTTEPTDPAINPNTNLELSGATHD